MANTCENRSFSASFRSQTDQNRHTATRCWKIYSPIIGDVHRAQKKPQNYLNNIRSDRSHRSLVGPGTVGHIPKIVSILAYSDFIEQQNRSNIFLNRENSNTQKIKNLNVFLSTHSHIRASTLWFPQPPSPL